MHNTAVIISWILQVLWHFGDVSTDYTVIDHQFLKHGGYRLQENALTLTLEQVPSTLRCTQSCVAFNRDVALFYNSVTKVCSCHSVNGIRPSDIHADVNVDYFTNADYAPAAAIPTSLPGYVSSFSGHSYIFSTTGSQWQDARDTCISFGGDLVAIETEEESMFLEGFIYDHSDLIPLNFWTSGTDTDEEGTYVWKSTNLPITWANWSPGQPNQDPADTHPSAQEDCCRMRSTPPNHQWSDVRCDLEHSFICERSWEDWEFAT